MDNLLLRIENLASLAFYSFLTLLIAMTMLSCQSSESQEAKVTPSRIDNTEGPEEHFDGSNKKEIDIDMNNNVLDNSNSADNIIFSDSADEGELFKTIEFEGLPEGDYSLIVEKNGITDTLHFTIDCTKCD